ncbi:MAG TPA: transglutaminase domain-containing protein [Armatimonadota bacterium]|nr:transglutaminase domain-containing protein [Armatimonadota bacterium]
MSIISSRLTFITWLSVCFGLIVVSTTQLTAADAQLAAHVQYTPRSVTGNIPALATYLTTPASSQRDKAWAIYRWVTGNVSYNVAGRLSGRLGDNHAEAVLNRRVAVCDGYANLYQALAHAAGLTVVKVLGVCKEDPFSPSAAKKSHAWNAVKIDDDWQLVDCTMGAGYLDGQLNFVHTVDDFYFCTPPEKFIFDHFPEDEKWQLLPNPLTAAQFDNLASVSPQFFEYGLHCAQISRRKITVDHSGTLTIDAPANVLLTATLYQNETPLRGEYALAQRSGDHYTITTVCPAAGSYQLRIFAKHDGDAGGYLCVAEFWVTASSGTPDSLMLPKVYGQFTLMNASVVSPLTKQIPAGAAVNFSLAVPGAANVLVVNGDDWVPLQGHDGHFAGKIRLRPGKTVVVAQQPGSESYGVLLEYLAK